MICPFACWFGEAVLLARLDGGSVHGRFEVVDSDDPMLLLLRFGFRWLMTARGIPYVGYASSLLCASTKFPAFHPDPVSRSVHTSPGGPLLPHDVERRHGVGGRESRARGAKHLAMDCPP